MSHSPEPWKAECDNGDSQIYDQNGNAVLPGDGWYDDSVEGRGERVMETLDRIVACVNACAGFPTAAIEPFMDKIREIMPMAGRIDQPDSPSVYLAMACGIITQAFDILHQHGMEWEQNS